MTRDFIRLCAATPEIRVADCAGNAARIAALIRKAAGDGAAVVVLPELCVTGYTCGDLFSQRTLLEGAEAALGRICVETRDCPVLAFVGLPVERQGRLYNCAAAICGGELLALIPKRELPGYGEFYEPRNFAPAPATCGLTARLCGKTVPFGCGLLLRCAERDDLVIGAEICEDLWVCVPPSSGLAAAGATLIVNLSASNEIVGKAQYRRELVKSQSSRLSCVYLYADAGAGESTTDMVFGGHELAAECGELIAECAPFAGGYLLADADFSRPVLERRRRNNWPDPADAGTFCEIVFHLDIPPADLSARSFSRLPFVPEDPALRRARCDEVFELQSRGLAARLNAVGNARPVLGLSGGLDSTLALLVCARALALSGRESSALLAFSMPCFGTGQRTRRNARALAAAVGASFEEIDISEAVRVHLRDLEQPDGVFDAAYENAQARERTQLLMDKANQSGGLVVGTGDLSELALGWATYNGDHMSMYAVNASVPKTLVRHIVAARAEAAQAEGNAALAAVLRDVLDTPVSPELLPLSQGELSQKTEDLIGPYELHDFFLYHMLRRGAQPEKLLDLANAAFSGAYPPEQIRHWLRVFLRRFFSQQFKRSCLPDGPKVGTVSLSPRGDWRMPSDAAADLWLSALD